MKRAPSNSTRAPVPLRRELLTFGLSVLFAVTILPVAIWIAGKLFLGDYLRDPGDPALARHGGPLALIIDMLRGLAEGSPGHWIALLGPYLLLMAFRLGRRWV